jgi:hypothetical protein
MKLIVKSKLIIITTLLIITTAMFAQQSREGVVNIHTDPQIDSLLQLHIAYNEAFPVLNGYRIHIYMGSGNEALDVAEEIKLEFEENYDDIPAYVTFAEPYYRVRVGDFRTRLEAEQFLERINRKYRNAWVIQEKINLPVIPKYQ